MYHNLEVPENCLQLWKTCHSLVPELLQKCDVKARDIKIIKTKPIDPEFKSVYLVKSGIISETYQGQVIVNYEEGDLIGIDGLLQPKQTTFENDFAVIVDEYDGEELMNEIFKDKNKFLIFNKYLSCLSQSYHLLASHFNKNDIQFSPDFRQHEEGSVIIEEDTEGDEVYTLISGSAKVIVNNTEVGVVNKDEI